VAEDGKNRPSEVIIRRRIRSHAMRNATTRNEVRLRVKKSKGAGGEDGSEGDAKPPDTPARGTAGKKKSTVVKFDPHSGGIEPYGGLPVVMNTHLKRLVHHCKIHPLD
jgi:hypothetical protein